MFFCQIITLLITQGLVGAYVIVDNNGFYPTWRSNLNSYQTHPTQWPTFISPQMYFPFIQNFNPFSWWQTQQQQQPQENHELNAIRDRQSALYYIIKCLVEEESRETCKKMLGKFMGIFPMPVSIFPTSTTHNIPSTVSQRFPMLNPTSMEMMSPIKPELIAEMKPEMIPKVKPEMIHDMKPGMSPINDMAPALSQEKPTEQMETNEDDGSLSTALVVEPAVLETKPWENEPAIQQKLPENENTVQTDTKVVEPVLLPVMPETPLESFEPETDTSTIVASTEIPTEKPIGSESTPSIINPVAVTDGAVLENQK